MTSNAKNFAQVFKTSFRRKTCEEKITSSQRLDSTTGIKYRLMIHEAQAAFPSAKIHVMKPDSAESFPGHDKK